MPSRRPLSTWRAALLLFWGPACASPAVVEEPVVASTAVVDASVATAPLSRRVLGCPERVVADRAVWSGDGRYLATSCASRACRGSRDELVDLWDLQTGALTSLDARGPANVAHFQLPGFVVTSSDKDQTRVTVFRLDTKAVVQRADLAAESTIAFDDATRVFVGGPRGQLAAIDVKSAIMLERAPALPRANDSFNALRYAKGARRLLVFDEGEGLRAWDPARLQAADKVVSLANMTGLSVSPALGRVALSIFRGQIDVYHPADLSLDRKLRGPQPQAKVTTVEWVDERHLVAIDEGKLTVFDADTGTARVLADSTANDCAIEIAARPSSGRFAMIDSACRLTVREPGQKAEPTFALSIITSGARPRLGFAAQLALSPRGDTVASITTGGELLVLDAGTGAVKQRTTLAGSIGASSEIEFNSDGSILAVMGAPIRLLRIADGKLATLQAVEASAGHAGLVISQAAFAGDAAAAACSSEKPSREKPTLLADFVAGR